MEVLPGVGVELVKLGESRAAATSRLGEPTSQHGSRAFYDEAGLLLHFDAADDVELIGLPYSQ